MIQDRHVLALNKARLLEALSESAQKLFVLRYGGEDPDHLHRRLRARRERPSRGTAKQRNELAPLHSITSSARVRNFGTPGHSSIYRHAARLDRPGPFVDLGGDEFGKVFGASA